jgi:hypothetical protein
VVKKTLRAQREARADAGAEVAGVSWEEQKRRRNRQTKLPGLRDKVLARIEAAEARKRAIEELYCSPGFFERTGKAEITALEEEKASLGPRIEALMSEWEEIEREIAAATDA